MADPTITADMPDAMAIAHFLERFADLMSNGQNAAYLRQAAVLIESLTVRLTAASDEENLWRYKYETVTHHADALEAECEAFKHDIDGHVAITTSILAERDALKIELHERTEELVQLKDALNREREELATQSKLHEQNMARLREGFDRERQGFEATIEKGALELGEARLAFERERQELQATAEAEKQSRAELDRERGELRARQQKSEDELAALRAASRRDNDEMQAKVVALETKRAELRVAFNRISNLRDRAIEVNGEAGGISPEKPAPEAGARLSAQWGERDAAWDDEANAIVPKATLQQARAQFEYLARECILRGDIASQVMCQLGAYALDMALVAGPSPVERLPVGDVALKILAHPGSI